jgi:hypothetical protein
VGVQAVNRWRLAANAMYVVTGLVAALLMDDLPLWRSVAVLSIVIVGYGVGDLLRDEARYRE